MTNISSAGTYNPTIVPAQIAGLMRISNSTDDYQIFRARVLVLTGPNKKKFFWTSSLVINDGRASSASNVFRPVDGREIERKMKSLSNKIAKLQSELNDLEAFKEFFA